MIKLFFLLINTLAISTVSVFANCWHLKVYVKDGFIENEIEFINKFTALYKTAEDDEKNLLVDCFFDLDINPFTTLSTPAFAEFNRIFFHNKATRKRIFKNLGSEASLVEMLAHLSKINVVPFGGRLNIKDGLDISEYKLLLDSGELTDKQLHYLLKFSGICDCLSSAYGLRGRISDNNRLSQQCVSVLSTGLLDKTKVMDEADVSDIIEDLLIDFSCPYTPNITTKSNLNMFVWLFSFILGLGLFSILFFLHRNLNGISEKLNELESRINRLDNNQVKIISNEAATEVANVKADLLILKDELNKIGNQISRNATDFSVSREKTKDKTGSDDGGPLFYSSIDLFVRNKEDLADQKFKIFFLNKNSEDEYTFSINPINLPVEFLLNRSNFFRDKYFEGIENITIDIANKEITPGLLKKSGETWVVERKAVIKA